MKFCVQAELVFDSEAKRDNVVSYAKNLIKNKPMWRERIDEVQVIPGIGGIGQFEDKPMLTVMIRFDLESDMRDVFDKVKSKVKTVSGIHGVIKIHRCGHDTLPFKPCVIEREFVI